MERHHDRGGCREVAWLAWPIVVGLLASTAMGVTDTWIVGRLGTCELAAVGLASMVFYTLNALVIGWLSGVKVLASEVPGQDAAGLRTAMDTLRDKLGSGIVVLGSVDEGKVSLCVGVTKDLTRTLKAGEIVKRLAPIVGGGGGGRPDMAQAGGKIPEKLPEAIQKTADVVRQLMSSDS